MESAASSILEQDQNSNFLNQLSDEYALVKREYSDVTKKTCRFKMHDCSREFAYAHFLRDPDFHRITHRFASYYLQLLHDRSREIEKSPKDAAYFYWNDVRNFDAAKDVFGGYSDISVGDAELLVKTFVEWHEIIHRSPSANRGDWVHTSARVARKLDGSLANQILYAKTLGLDGRVASFGGRSNRAYRQYKKSLRVLQTTQSRVELSKQESHAIEDLIRAVERRIGWFLMDTNRPEHATRWFEGLISVVEQSKHPNKGQHLIDVLDALGDAYTSTGQIQQARKCFVQVLVRLRAPGGRLIPAAAFTALALL
jgi:tetratricopeptide (TPR) repeat protein